MLFFSLVLLPEFNCGTGEASQLCFLNPFFNFLVEVSPMFSSSILSDDGRFSS